MLLIDFGLVTISTAIYTSLRVGTQVKSFENYINIFVPYIEVLNEVIFKGIICLGIRKRELTLTRQYFILGPEAKYALPLEKSACLKNN